MYGTMHGGIGMYTKALWREISLLKQHWLVRREEGVEQVLLGDGLHLRRLRR